MVTTQTKKKALAFRVSDETYNRVIGLTQGDNPPFESLSEYLYTVVISDLARREVGGVSLREEIIQILQEPEMSEFLKSLIINK